eukprot:5553162-Alexandrium_andersonii.AAC.1
MCIRDRSRTDWGVGAKWQQMVTAVPERNWMGTPGRVYVRRDGVVSVVRRAFPCRRCQRTGAEREGLGTARAHVVLEVSITLVFRVPLVDGVMLRCPRRSDR